MLFLPEFNWIVTPTAMIGSLLVYFAVLIGLKFFRVRLSEPFVKFAMTLYNLTQIVINSAMVVGLATPLWLTNTKFSFFGFNTTYQKDIEMWILVHYLSKWVDWLDTVFMFVRGKYEQASFLHIYHHSTVHLIWGFLLHIGHGNGTAAYGAILNSFVHIVMYSHYLTASLNWKNPFKKYVTTLQIVQFYLDILHAVLVLWGWDPYPKNLALLQFLYTMSMMILFTQLYRRQYK